MRQRVNDARNNKVSQFACSGGIKIKEEKTKKQNRINRFTHNLCKSTRIESYLIFY